MQKYHGDYTCSTNCVDLNGTPGHAFEPESLNTFNCTEFMLTPTLAADHLEVDFWEQSDVPSHWNLYWTEAARDGGGGDINAQVYGQHWTRYLGAHSGVG